MIVFATTCKGRTAHLTQTLPKNLADNTLPDSKFLVLDYNSQDGLTEFLQQNHQRDIDSGRLIVYSFPAPGPFHVALAKNLAHRLAMHEGADFLVTVDADNFTNANFDRYILYKFKHEKDIFLRPGMVRVGERRFVRGSYGEIFPQKRGIAGRLAIRTQDFVKAGGYNEEFSTWRGEDMDLNARLGRMGFIARDIDPIYLNAITHSAEVRFKEYPHAQLLYENNDVLQEVNGATNTLVSYGSFGCGTAYRNFDFTTPVTMTPIPTRVFGIGMHKTATTSLHKAFQTLGFDSLHWGTGEAPRIWQEMNKFGASHTLEKYYALSDLPIPLLYKKLDVAYPNSKFILTLRDEEKWLKSVRGLYDPKINPTRWTWDVYPITNRLHHALYGRVDFDPATMLATYRRHNAEVREYFKDRPEDLLIMDHEKGAGWVELCNFLNKPIPNIDYPHAYRTSELT